ncbi:dipeptide ABC transporter ATP-binding protein [Roseicyclus sp. F158]|uniref:Dipeptide ABC transporter ATP-binding protein n=1 Tax=Tropicimonas omnivorans TaxID=3075590 RepID=A0ABU3DD12_9RHOB|nr:dipeptide ABC transporter ATP-binding protein [Roseicyclus sp. F158]MDT0681605.1 dipeptide ABC transporter ATP-binding protein [Roseicyclus sp. F158]
MKGDVLLRAKALRKHFTIGGGFLGGGKVVQAVDRIDLEIREGETLSIVGESGCGKSTLARLLLRLIEPTDGEVLLEGRDLTKFGRSEMRRARRDLQMVFQDPFASLNPRATIRDILTEPLRLHGIGTAAERRSRVDDLLRMVGLSPDHARRYPHEFSGGQRQRIGIARALSLNPRLIVADEPVSALDVSVQAQVINLLKDLQEELGLAYLVIAHDLTVVRHISDTVAVMYLGRIVEIAPAEELYRAPRHPYTQALLSAIPVADPAHVASEVRLEGDLPSPVTPPSGCHFHTRCPFATPECAADVPEARDLGGGHRVLCRRLDEIPAFEMPQDTAVAGPETAYARRLAALEAATARRQAQRREGDATAPAS